MGFKQWLRNLLSGIVGGLISMFLFSLIFLAIFDFSIQDVMPKVFESVYDLSNPEAQKSVTTLLENSCEDIDLAQESEVVVAVNELCNNPEKLEQAKIACANQDSLNICAQKETILKNCAQIRELDAQGLLADREALEACNQIDSEKLDAVCSFSKNELEQTCSYINSGQLDQFCQLDQEQVIKSVTDTCKKDLEGEELFKEMMAGASEGITSNEMGKKIDEALEQKPMIITACILAVLLLTPLYFLLKGIRPGIHSIAAMCIRNGLLFIAGYAAIRALFTYYPPDPSFLLETVGTGMLDIPRVIKTLVPIMLNVIIDETVLMTGIALVSCGFFIWLITRGAKSTESNKSDQKNKPGHHKS